MLELPPPPDPRGHRTSCGMTGCGNRAGGVVRVTSGEQEQHLAVCHTHAALQAAARALSLDLFPDDA